MAAVSRFRSMDVGEEGNNRRPPPRQNGTKHLARVLRRPRIQDNEELKVQSDHHPLPTAGQGRPNGHDNRSTGDRFADPAFRDAFVRVESISTLSDLSGTSELDNNSGYGSSVSAKSLASTGERKLSRFGIGGSPLDAYGFAKGGKSHGLLQLPKRTTSDGSSVSSCSSSSASSASGILRVARRRASADSCKPSAKYTLGGSNKKRQGLTKKQQHARKQQPPRKDSSSSDRNSSPRSFRGILESFSDRSRSLRMSLRRGSSRSSNGSVSRADMKDYTEIDETERTDMEESEHMADYLHPHLSVTNNNRFRDAKESKLHRQSAAMPMRRDSIASSTLCSKELELQRMSNGNGGLSIPQRRLSSDSYSARSFRSKGGKKKSHSGSTTQDNSSRRRLKGDKGKMRIAPTRLARGEKRDQRKGMRIYQ